MAQLQFSTDIILSTDLVHYRDVDDIAQLPKRLLVPLNSPMLWNGVDSLLVDIAVSGGVRPVVCSVTIFQTPKIFIRSFFACNILYDLSFN